MKKKNPCLIGEPGVGKTVIAEGLALRIATGDVPETIEGKTVRVNSDKKCSTDEIFDLSVLKML
jgi:ATP-dependent Clp protease ATP-binding subunit ClpA